MKKEIKEKKITHYCGEFLTNKGLKVSFDWREEEMSDAFWGIINDSEWLWDDKDLIWCGKENPFSIIAGTIIGIYYDFYVE